MSECNKPCAGNASQTCGGAYRLQTNHVRGCRTVDIAAPYCNGSLPLEARVADLVGRLSLAEKAACITTSSCNLDRFGLRADGFTSEALHGLRYPCATDVPGHAALCASSSPHAQLLAASFNRSLWHAVGTVVALLFMNDFLV